MYNLTIGRLIPLFFPNFIFGLAFFSSLLYPTTASVLIFNLAGISQQFGLTAKFN